MTAQNLNVPTDYESLKELGAIMGSGGLIVMNEDTCMVDTARFFMDFIRDESCGKCTACRIGTKRMLEILERITRGEGEEGDVKLLIELGETIQDTAMCGLGQTAPNPVLSTIKYFREEYDEHIRNKYCRAGVCSELFVSPCENTCPANVNVPGYMALIAAGRFIDAYNLIRQENPFPAVCGRICTRPCERKCRRNQLDEALAICDLALCGGHAMNENHKHDIVPKNGKGVHHRRGRFRPDLWLLPGAAGLRGDVYEAHNWRGGVLAYGIPNTGCPDADHEVRLIDRPACAYTSTPRWARTYCQGAAQQFRRRIHRDRRAAAAEDRIPGDRCGRDTRHQVLKLASAPAHGHGENVVVIGGGNTAIGSAHRAAPGREKVTIMYRRTIDMMPAYESKVHEALAEGIEIMELAAPVGIIMGEQPRSGSVPQDGAGRLRFGRTPAVHRDIRLRFRVTRTP